MVMCADDLLIAEVRTYGTGAGDDDLVEIHNPTAREVSLVGVDLAALKPDFDDGVNAEPTRRWSGKTGQSIPPGGRFLVVGAGFTGAFDDHFEQGIGDESIVFLRRGPMGARGVIDHVCICKSDCTGSEWGGCPGVHQNPAFDPQDGMLTVDDTLQREPDCRDTDQPGDFRVGEASPGQPNTP